ncbi:MAG: hypothetical protein HY900_09280, partial [Deltaproteobacteria bacterium]|nr:hypothetical protein [Deltaproteobacteria bacterium]
VESASDATLAGLGKAYGRAEVERAADLLEKADVPCLWVFLLGGPGETEATVRETLAFAAARKRPRDAAYLSAGIRVYPGTRLEAIARSEGVLDLPAAEMLRPTFYVSPPLGGGRLLRLVRAAVSENPHFYGPGALPGWAMPAVRWAARARGWALPLWQHTRRLRSMLGYFRFAAQEAS